MARAGPGTARRIEVPSGIRATDTLEAPDYAAAWEVGRSTDDPRGAEAWGRAVFEGAPAVLTAFVVAGWRWFLGLRLGPRPSPDHVLGWPIVTDRPALMILAASFRYGTAHNLVQVETSRVVVTTFVRYEKRGGRVLWAVAAPIHHRTIPFLLGRAARTRPTAGGAVATGT